MKVTSLRSLFGQLVRVFYEAFGPPFGDLVRFWMCLLVLVVSAYLSASGVTLGEFRPPSGAFFCHLSVRINCYLHLEFILFFTCTFWCIDWLNSWVLLGAPFSFCSQFRYYVYLCAFWRAFCFNFGAPFDVFSPFDVLTLVLLLYCLSVRSCEPE
jgi:hypothetical protein